MLLIKDGQSEVQEYPTPDYLGKSNIKIPAAAIGYETSVVLLEIYNLMEEGDALELEIYFETAPTANKVWLQFWFQTIDERVIQFIRDFKPYRDKLGDQVGF